MVVMYATMTAGICYAIYYYVNGVNNVGVSSLTSSCGGYSYSYYDSSYNKYYYYSYSTSLCYNKSN